MTSTLCLVFAIVASALAVSLASPSEYTLKGLAPNKIEGNDTKARLDRYIAVTEPMTWSLANVYCRDHYGGGNLKRHLPILEISEEIYPVTSVMQVYGLECIWTDGRSNVAGTSYVWYTLNNNVPIDLPELEQPCPGEDVYTNGLKLCRGQLTGVPLSTRLPFVCEIPLEPTA